VARAFLSAGAQWLQLRCKDMPSGAFLDLASAVVSEAASTGATVIVNDRADIARLSAAHGLHVGQTDLSPADSRTVIGSSAILGLSTHTKAQWEAALLEPISYLAIGPAFGTGTKETGYSAVGLDIVAAAARAASVAVISDLLKGDPETRCREFLRVLS
jgi:thiamine-phosphate pyrophosphorylase